MTVKKKEIFSGIKLGDKDKTGNKIINSTSKIIKIMATRKNCVENNDRWKFFIENPHSKGDNFSISKCNFFVVNIPSNNKIMLINKDNNNNCNNKVIGNFQNLSRN